MSIYIQPPCRRTVIIEAKRYFLSFPYIVMKIGDRVYSDGDTGKSMDVAFTLEQPKNRTPLYIIPMCNFIDVFRICLGDRIKSDQAAIDAFWFKEFKNQYISRLRCPQEFIRIEDRYNDTVLVDYDKWAKLSMDDIFKVNWRRSAFHTFKHFKPNET